MLADLFSDTAEKHKQSAAMVVSNREVMVFSYLMIELLCRARVRRRSPPKGFYLFENC